MPVPIVPLILAGAGLAQGLVQQSRARKLEKSASDLNKNIQGTDPGMLQLLGDIRARRRYAEAGTTKLMGLKSRLITDAGNQSQVNLMRGSGGNSGALINALGRSQRMTQNAIAGAAADTEQTIPNFLQMEAPLVMDMADRQHQLQLYDRDLQMARAARARRDANDNIMGAIGLLASNDWSAGNAPAPPPTGSMLKGVNSGVGQVGGREPLTSGFSNGLMRGVGAAGSSMQPTDGPVPVFEYPGSMQDTQEPLFG